MPIERTERASEPFSYKTANNLPAFAKYVQILSGFDLTRKPGRLTESEIAEAKRMRESGMTYRSIARYFDCGHQRIIALIDPRKPARFFHPEDLKQRFFALRKGGVSTRKAAEMLGVSRGTVGYWEYGKK